MRWPTHPGSTTHAAILRHNARQSAHTPQTRADYACAVDVWRDGAHLWRSWDTATGISVDDYAARVLGPLYPTDHDNGTWGVPGVEQVADWPVPTDASLSPPMSLQAVLDTCLACAAIAQWPNEPYELDAVPTRVTLAQRLARSDNARTVLTFKAGEASVRALVVHRLPGAGDVPESPACDWLATLRRRHVRAGAVDTPLPEGDAVFAAPVDAPPHVLARLAKAALGITGRQAQRRDPSALVWHITMAPYTMTITRETSQ